MQMVAERWIVFLVSVLLWGVVGCAGDAADSSKGQVRVAAASDLKFALDSLVVAFEQNHPEVDVSVSYGSSGQFYAQLQNKAPFDLYLSADMEYPQKLLADGRAMEGTAFRYAVGRIAVWVPETSPLDLDGRGIEALADPSVEQIAIANPRHAPYGRAAEAALKSLGMYSRVEERIVLGENVAQTAQLVESGAADAGIIALSLALAPQMRRSGRYWVVPLDAYPRMEQGGVVLPWARDLEATKQLRAFMMDERGRSILEQYGFSLPDA